MVRVLANNKNWSYGKYLGEYEGKVLNKILCYS